jgi:hypothetical protein
MFNPHVCVLLLPDREKAIGDFTQACTVGSDGRTAEHTDGRTCQRQTTIALLISSRDNVRPMVMKF